MRPASGRNGPERAGRRPPIASGASIKRCVRTLGLPPRQRRAKSERRLTAGRPVPTRLVSLALGMALAILGTQDLARADVHDAPWLWAFAEGQTRIRLQWSRGSDAVIDHKIEVCAELDAGDCDETDWTVLVADHPQEPSFTRSNRYKHEGLPAGSTRHYRVSSRNDDGLGAPSTVWSATTNSMVLVPGCAGAFWSAEVTVARSVVFDKRGYISPSLGSISDSEFSRRAATHMVTQLYFNQTSRFEEVNYGWTPDYHFAITTALPETRLGDFVLYVGEVTLPFGSVTAHSTQTYGESYRWGSAEYEDTFDYVAGDKVTVCLTDAAPIVTLVLTPDSISENGGSSTVTATVEQGSADPFTVTVSAVPPAGTGDLTLSDEQGPDFPGKCDGKHRRGHHHRREQRRGCARQDGDREGRAVIGGTSDRPGRCDVDDHRR